MLKSKEIKRLTDRVEALEKRLNSLFLPPPVSNGAGERSITYEEVINEWLCGKEAQQR